MSHLTKSSASSVGRVTSLLAQFMRTNYSAEAESEAARHVAVYQENNQHELAGIWISVMEELKKKRA